MGPGSTERPGFGPRGRTSRRPICFNNRTQEGRLRTVFDRSSNYFGESPKFRQPHSRTAVSSRLTFKEIGELSLPAIVPKKVQQRN